MNVSKRFVRILLIIFALCLLPWVLFGLDYGYAKTAVGQHYGSATKVSVCTGGGAVNRQELEYIDSLQFASNGTNEVPLSFATPFLPVTTNYQYDLAYTKHGEAWEATGSVDYLGHIREYSNNVFSGGGGCEAICLSAGTKIDTDKGQQPVTLLKTGDRVWSLDNDDHKVLVPIIKVGHRAVPAGTTLLQVALADSRQLLVSPNHPTVDGVPFKDLKVGGILDHTKIISITNVSYKEGYTYDILPQSSTGAYWANGILVGSTLK